MSRYKCTCKSCCMNINGECKLSATQVFNMGCNEFIRKEAEYVDFAEAWKAYEKGRVIQAAQTGNKKKKLLGLVQMFDEFEIRNKWLILEDE